MQFEFFRQRSVSFDISKHELKYKIHIRLTISLQKYNFKLAIFSHLTIYFSQLIIYFSQATIHLWPGNYFLNLQFMTRPDHLLSWSLQLKDANTGESKDFQVYLKTYHPWFSSFCVFFHPQKLSFCLHSKGEICSHHSFGWCIASLER